MRQNIPLKYESNEPETLRAAWKTLDDSRMLEKVFVHGVLVSEPMYTY